MADRSEKSDDKAADKPSASEVAKDDDTTYTRDQLRAQSYERFGASWPVVAGALENAGISKLNVSKAEVEDAVTKYLKHEDQVST